MWPCAFFFLFFFTVVFNLVIYFCWRSDHSRHGSHREESLSEAKALLQSTQSTLEELHKEVGPSCAASHIWNRKSGLHNSLILSVPQCEFLQSDSAAVLSPCALKVAISDMSQLMTAFGHIYNTDFKGYCQRTPPALSSGSSVFQSVHQLLHTCNTVKHCTSFICNKLTEISFHFFASINLNII